MKKALLIGNGFTSQLIKEFGNGPMMKKFYDKMPTLVDRAESSFAILRNMEFTKNDLYNISIATFCGDNLICGENVYPSSDGIHIKDDCRTWVVGKLKSLNFTEPEKIFQLYFEDYGLLYLINSEKIVGMETLLKVVHMFIQTNVFTEDDYESIKNVANNVYYNNGNHGAKHINNNNISRDKLCDVLSQFQDVYTTNYDTILDDFLDEQDRFPFHLHGGFSINNLNRNPGGRYIPSAAKLIWGINAETKFKELKPGFNWSDFNWGAFRWGDSQISDYFGYLQEREYDEIHILGFSGENDDHINQRIKANAHIKNIVVYVNPVKVIDNESQVRSRILFSGDTKAVNLKSWDEFWNSVKI